MLIAREIGGHSWIDLVKTQTWAWQAAAVFSNIFMIGLDAIMYAQGHGLLYGDNQSSIVIVSPAWSLSLEIVFVVLSPFLVRMPNRLLVAVIVASQVSRWLFLLAGHEDNFWAYRFFPFECGLFCSGAFAYKIWKSADAGVRDTLSLASPIVCLIALTVLLWPLPPEVSRLLFLAMITVFIPGLFTLSKDWRLDRWLGDLSYSFYLWHLLVLGVLTRLLPEYVTPAATVGTLALSALTHILVQMPVDNWRHRVGGKIASIDLPSRA